jgi:predicted nuclease with TOPRIM domain
MSKYNKELEGMIDNLKKKQRELIDDDSFLEEELNDIKHENRCLKVKFADVHNSCKDQMLVNITVHDEL